MRRPQNHKGGFTLIELMIAVAIIGVLSSIAMALFRDQQLRTKRTEAMTNLSAISKLQRSYFGEFGNYQRVVPAPLTPIGPMARPWSSVAGAVFDPLGFSVEGAVYYDYDVEAAGGGGCGCQECFTASAYGDLEGDGMAAVLSFVHPDSLGAICLTQALALGPPIDFQTGQPIFDAPARHLPPIVDDY